MDDGLDQCRAPQRKRKPMYEEQRERRVVRMTWDIDPATTNEMIRDTGVSVFEDDDQMELDAICKPVPTRQPTTSLVPKTNLQHTTTANAGGTILGLHQLKKHDPYEIDNMDFDNMTLMTGIKRPPYPVDHINKLSDEIILLVLKWLTKPALAQCLRVCKRWYQLSMDESLWRRLDLAAKVIPPETMGRIIDRGTTILRLARAEVKGPIYRQVADPLSPKIAALQYLDLTMALIDTACLEELLSRCHRLRKLCLENCEINDTICRYVGQNTNMETLNLCMCEGISENGLVPICKNLARLDALNISWNQLSRGAIVYLVTCLPPTITKLNLSGCKDVILDEDVLELCRSCYRLKELDLSDSSVITANAVQCIVAMLPSLEFLALSRCYSIAPVSFLLLAKLPCLLAFNVYSMLKENAIEHLCDRLPNIQVNKYPFSSIARPTTGIRRTSIWGLRVRDNL